MPTGTDPLVDHAKARAAARAGQPAPPDETLRGERAVVVGWDTDVVSPGYVVAINDTDEGTFSLVPQGGGSGGTGDALTVRGKAIPSLGAAQDGRSWVYDHAAGAMVWTDLATPAEVDTAIAAAIAAAIANGGDIDDAIDAAILANGASGIELAYAEIATSFTAPSNAAADVPGLAITLAEPARPYLLRAFTYGLAGSVLNQYAFMQIVEVGGAAATVALAENYVTGVAGTGRAATAEARIPAPAVPGAARTFKVQTLGGGASAPTITAAPTGKAFLLAVTL